MEHYLRRPVKEALLDIRASLPIETTLEILESFHEKISKRFPEKQQRFSWSSGVQFKPGSEPEVITPSGGPDGFLFRSPLEGKVVQARRDGFTFNKLRPYKSWEAFLLEAKELWRFYVDIAKPNSVSRLALRYINQIEIPLPVRDLKKYVLTAPQIAPGIPAAIASFLMQLVISNAEINAFANITETIESISEDREYVPFILDIDVYRNIVLEPGSPQIWEKMEELRQFKNLIFAKSTTNKCKELFR